MPLVPSRIIERKRRGGELTPDEIEWMFGRFLTGDVPDYQMAALLMAVHFQGMGPAELDTLLDLMIRSGAVLDLSHLPGPRVDKHSTGGVGDKTSLVLAPLAAELGLYVPMISGRGLGHTAGTLDKLEAIPGFRTGLTLDEFRSVLEDVGVAMMGQTDEIAPLDRRLYALRDATATVPSIPLIAASILSKKLAEGVQGLVLDVKTGSGSFVPGSEESRELAMTMTSLGNGRGVRTAALVTGMDAPLGRAVGNGLETREALASLAGSGPRDLTHLAAALTGEMLFLGGLAPDPEGGARSALEALEEGRAIPRMARLVERQGGDPRVVTDTGLIPLAPERDVLTADIPGFVREILPVPLGYGVVEMGGGRRRMEDELDPRVGFVLAVCPGDRVERGDPLGEIHAANADGLERGRQVLRGAVVLGPEAPPPRPPLIRERISTPGWASSVPSAGWPGGG
jgi:pyrimidine-nucleoside phosphorylase